MSEPIIVEVDQDLADLIPAYLENRKADIKNIEETLTKNDFAAIQQIGHPMKGSGGGYGFDRITEIGTVIEQAAKDQDADKIRKAVHSLKDYLEQVEVKYRELDE